MRRKTKSKSLGIIVRFKKNYHLTIKKILKRLLIVSIKLNTFQHRPLSLFFEIALSIFNAKVLKKYFAAQTVTEISDNASLTKPIEISAYQAYDYHSVTLHLTDKILNQPQTLKQAFSKSSANNNHKRHLHLAMLGAKSTIC